MEIFEITDPAAHRSWKFPGLEPVVREIDPGGLFANGLLIPRDIVRRNIVLSWVVLVSSNAAPIKARDKASLGRNRDTNGLCVQRRGTSHEQQVNCFHRTTVRRALWPAKLATGSPALSETRTT